MIKIDVISGFLGAGKTTLIKRLLRTNITDEKVMLVENEFGQIGIDAGFLKETKVDIKEINQGCICCSLKGDFSEALKEVVNTYSPQRIIIEPSGVGKLSDILSAIENTGIKDFRINALVCVCDAKKIKMYLNNFGEFYIDQIKNAKTIFLSRTDITNQKRIDEGIELIKEINDNATIVTTNINELSDELLLESYNGVFKDLEEETLNEMTKHHHDHHHHHEGCTCGCHDHEHEHHHHEGCTCGCHDHEQEHHHEECTCGCHDHEHEHHHEGCTCGCHNHEHEHHHHHADEVFQSIGIETTKQFSSDEIENILNELFDDKEYGLVLRAKGIVAGENTWYYFDMVPGETEIRTGETSIIGKICVIGSKLKEDKIKELFLK